jgi:hypothetical protein
LHAEVAKIKVTMKLNETPEPSLQFSWLLRFGSFCNSKIPPCFNTTTYYTLFQR